MTPGAVAPAHFFALRAITLSPTVPPVRALKFLSLFLLLAGPLVAAPPPAIRLIKVLPHYLDREGRHSLSPSLYERDAYQAQLRKHPAQRSGLRFDVQWKSHRAAPLKLRLDMRGSQASQPTTATIETALPRPGVFSKWSSVALVGAEYKAFGELVAWRATLWDGDQRVAEQKSFLW